MSLPPSLADPLIDRVARRLDLMGDLTRIKLLLLLRDGEERPVQWLSDRVATTTQNVCRHLKELRDAGLVEKRKSGVYSCYAIADPMPLKVLEEVVAFEHPRLVRLADEERPPGNGGVRTAGRTDPRTRVAG